METDLWTIPRAKIRVITVIMPRNRERGRGQSQLRSGSSLGIFPPKTQTRNQGFFEKNLPTGLNSQRATKTPTSNVATKNDMDHGFPHWAAGCWTEWNALSFADIEAFGCEPYKRTKRSFRCSVFWLYTLVFSQSWPKWRKEKTD